MPRDFMPTNRFSTKSNRPIPCLCPYWFKEVKIVAGDILFPLIATGSPLSNSISIISGSSGASSGLTVR